MPPRYRQRVESVGLRRSVADYLAGMTDRFLSRDAQRRLG
jgi:dGTP triphosphohydrolase